MTVILLGTLWGFLEATLGGVLHAMHFPLTGSIMAPIGFTILFLGMRRGLKVSNLVTISLIAASFKFFDVFLFQLTPFQSQITNPAQAILMQGLSFAGFAWLLKDGSAIKRFAGSFAMATVSVAMFNIVSFYIVGHGAPILSHPLNAILIHLPVTIIATYLLIDKTSKLDVQKLDILTLTNTSLTVRAAVSFSMLIASILAQKWLA